MFKDYVSKKIEAIFRIKLENRTKLSNEQKLLLEF